MHAFLYTNRQPVTKEARSHVRYEQELKQAFRRYSPVTSLQVGQFYGVVYYFHKGTNQIDADNLGKPVFDALKGELYTDDRIVQIVRSGTFDLTSNNIEVLNLTRMPDKILPDFLQALDKAEHILYVEVGNLDFAMFEFGCEQ